MPSSYSASLRFELQFTGENVNTWGVLLNGAISRIDSAIAGWTTIALTGNYTLTTANGSADEARSAMLKFTGTGAYTVSLPAVSKRYDIWNALTGVLTIGAGGVSATLQPGERVAVMCNGTDTYRIQPTDFGGVKITSVADPTNAQDVATKAYADNLAFTANSGILPGQVGSAGKFLTTNGTVASWSFVTVSSISDYAADQAAKIASTTATALAYAVSLIGNQ